MLEIHLHRTPSSLTTMEDSRNKNIINIKKNSVPKHGMALCNTDYRNEQDLLV